MLHKMFTKFQCDDVIVTKIDYGHDTFDIPQSHYSVDESMIIGEDVNMGILASEEFL